MNNKIKAGLFVVAVGDALGVPVEFESGNDSLRKFLSDIEAVKVKPDSKERIRSIDTPSDYENAIRKIKLSGRLE